MNPKKLMITGAAGFTGRHACQHFTEAGFQVIPVIRTRAGSDFEFKQNVVECDLTRKCCVLDMINRFQPDYVLHLAGQNAVDQSWKDPFMTFESNVISTLYLLEAIRKSGNASKVVVVGSALEMDPSNTIFPQHPYSLSKTIQTLCSRSWANLFSMNIMVAKPTNLIGPGYSNGICSIIARQVAAMIKGQRENLIEVNNLSARRDFLDVRDAVKAYHILLENGDSGKIYDIASEVTHSVEEVVLGFQKMADIKITLQSKTTIPESTDINFDTSEMKELGWYPNIPFHVTLQDVLTFHLQQT